MHRKRTDHEFFECRNDHSRAVRNVAVVNPGRNIGSQQLDVLQTHTHTKRERKI